MIIYDLLTDSTAAVVTLSEAKLHCKVDNDVDDPLISNLITAAKKTFEKFSNRALFNQEWVASFDYYDFVKCKDYFLPYGKIQSVTSVVTYDTDNNPTTINPVDYRTFANRFIFNSNYTLPAYSNYRTDGALEITWEVGFGSAAGDIPQDIKQACLLLIRHWYENRGAIYEAIGGKSDLETLPLGVVDIFMNYRIFEV
jgi:uncharacterized phiE125 gp8 family phage protein